MALTTLRMPMLGTSVLVSFLLLFPVLGLAQSSEIDALRSVLNGLQQQLQKALERIDQLEKEKSTTSTKLEQLDQEKSASTARITGTATRRKRRGRCSPLASRSSACTA